jgi:nitrous oxidase accessory protein
LSGPGFGIYGHQLTSVVVRGNEIRGDIRLNKLDRGDGIHLLRVNKPLISNNQIHYVRDGVYLESGSGSQVYGNTFTEQQYGIHYMYTKDDEAMNNRASQVDGGYALMNAEAINLGYNQVSQAREFGVLLNMTDNARIHGNHIDKVSAPYATAGDIFAEGKGIFIYGARGNHVYDNHIAANDIGIAMALGGECNLVYHNQFIDNSTQVRYVGEQPVEWSLHQRGNYWSDYRGWDLNGDGIGDSIYLPNDRLDRLFWLYPEASFLMDSPIVMLLKWVDSRLQLNNLTGVMDSYPLMESRSLWEVSQ